MAETLAAIERPILFSGAMVRAILEGRKTQTRRALNPQPGPCDHKVNEEYEGCHIPTEFFMMSAGDWACRTCGNGMRMTRNDAVGIRCPYGKPGDMLWVRETFIQNPAEYDYYLSSSVPIVPDNTVYRADVNDPNPGPWKPAIHMPRKLSRLTLEITKVRVERVQEITYEDAKAEGCEVTEPRMFSLFGADAQKRQEIYDIHGRLAYEPLWDSINAKRENGMYAWSANPWVWVIEFSRAERG